MTGSFRLCFAAFCWLGAIIFLSPAIALVDMNNASFSTTFVDLFGDDGVPEVRSATIVRAYKSRTTQVGLFGFGWCSELENSLTRSADGGWEFSYCGDGRTVMFAPPEGSDNAGRQTLSLVSNWALNKLGAQPISYLSKPEKRDEASIELHTVLREEFKLNSEIWHHLLKATGLIGDCPPGFSQRSIDSHHLMTCTGNKIRIRNDENGDESIFDSKLRLTTILPLGSTPLMLERDTSDKITRIKRIGGQSIEFFYTPKGRVSKIRRSDGVGADYYYDNDLLVKVNNAWLKTYLYEYNEYKNLTRLQWPDGTFIEITYDNISDWVTSLRDRDGCLENYSYTFQSKLQYDANVIKRCGKNVTSVISFAFDHFRRGDDSVTLKSVRENRNGFERYIQYNEQNEFPEEIQTGTVGTGYVTKMKYRYDAQARLVWSSTPRGIEEYRYDGNSSTPIFASKRSFSNRVLKQVRSSNVYVRRFVSDSMGRVVRVESPIGVHAVREFDVKRRATQIDLPNGRSLAIKWAQVDRRIERIENNSGGYIAFTPSVPPKQICEKVYQPNESSLNRAEQLQLCDLVRAALNELAPLNDPYFTEKPDPKLNAGVARLGESFEAVLEAEQRADFAAVKPLLEAVILSTSNSPGFEKKIARTAADLAWALAREAIAAKQNAAAEQLYRLALDYHAISHEQRYEEIVIELAGWLKELDRKSEALELIDTTFGPGVPRSSASQWSYHAFFLRTDLLIEQQRGDEAFALLLACSAEECRQQLPYDYKLRLVQLAVEADRPIIVLPILRELRMRAELERIAVPSADLGNRLLLQYVNLLENLGQDREALELMRHEGTLWLGSIPDRRAVIVALKRATFSRRLGRFTETAQALKQAGELCLQMPEEKFCTEGLKEQVLMFDLAIGNKQAAAAQCENLHIVSGKEIDGAINNALACASIGRPERVRKIVEGIILQEGRRKPTWVMYNLRAWEAHLLNDLPARVDKLRDAAMALDDTLGPTNWRSVRAHLWVAQALLESGQASEARSEAIAALPGAALASGPEFRVMATRLIAETSRVVGEREASIYWGKQTAKQFEALRIEARGLDVKSQRSLLDDNKEIYNNLAAWLVSAGRLAEAEEVLARLKQEELFDLTREASVQQNEISYSGVEKRISAKFDELNGHVVELSEELELILRLRDSGKTLTPNQRARLAELQETKRHWREKFERFMQMVEPTLSEAPSSAQELRARLEANVRGVRSVLQHAGPGHLSVHFAVAESELAIIVSSAQTQKGYQVPVGREELSRQVAAFRHDLATPNSDPLPAARQLFKTLIEPITSELEALERSSAELEIGTTLILSLTDVLRYIPFGALHDGNRYLVERFAVVLRSEAVQVQTDRQTPDSWKVAAFGVTKSVDFPDDRHHFAPLPAVGRELAAIARTASTPSGVLAGSISLDSDFSRAALEEAIADKSQHQVIHVASHFNFMPSSEYASYLVLGDRSRISLADLRELNFNGVDLLTLSACNTGLGGGRNERGSEIEGLGATLQLAGARSVIASLWSVSDASTAELMAEFYRQRTGGTKIRDAAQALRNAQLNILHGSPFQSARPQPWGHPFYWAPFVLIGQWQ